MIIIGTATGSVSTQAAGVTQSGGGGGGGGTLYFYKGVSDSWYTVANWYTDSSHISEAGTLPTASNDVVVLSDCELDFDNPAWEAPLSLAVQGNGIDESPLNGLDDGFILHVYSVAGGKTWDGPDITGAGRGIFEKVNL